MMLQNHLKEIPYRYEILNLLKLYFFDLPPSYSFLIFRYKLGKADLLRYLKIFF